MNSRFIVCDSKGLIVFVILGIGYGDHATARKVADELGFKGYRVYDSFNYGRGNETI